MTLTFRDWDPTKGNISLPGASSRKIDSEEKHIHTHTGFSLEDLNKAKQIFEANGATDCEIHNLNDFLPEQYKDEAE